MIVGLQPLRGSFVVFVKNNPDGEVTMVPLEPFNLSLGVQL